MGEQNNLWQGTPLIVLFEHYNQLFQGRGRYAAKQAGRALGHLLKRVIVEDKRIFTTHIAKRVRHYQWDGLRANDNVNYTPAWLEAAAPNRN